MDVLPLSRAYASSLRTARLTIGRADKTVWGAKETAHIIVNRDSRTW